MLIFIKNWCFYTIILVHLLFSTVFYIFSPISVSFGPINMLLGAFERVFKGLQKPGPNWLRPVQVFAVFTSQKLKDRTLHSV